jgi:hypothetical protein
MNVSSSLVPRFEVLLDSGLAGVDLDAHIARADLVVTAEGAIDFQTPRRKVPAEVARRAQAAGVPVLALAGSTGKDSSDVHAAGIDALAGRYPVYWRAFLRAPAFSASQVPALGSLSLSPWSHHRRKTGSASAAAFMVSAEFR